MLYMLSRIIPVRMQTEYKERGQRYKESWWQWRGHIWADKKKRI